MESYIFHKDIYFSSLFGAPAPHTLPETKPTPLLFHLSFLPLLSCLFQYAHISGCPYLGGCLRFWKCVRRQCAEGKKEEKGKGKEKEKKKRRKEEKKSEESHIKNSPFATASAILFK
ncbi:MAG: hypothetical protein K2M53_08030 [Muribaculaceae bacterium]|nr:hypothetical protein [Muribaculaceae bacterium]